MSTKRLLKQIGQVGLARIELAVREAEKRTSAEIAVYVREWSGVRALFGLGRAASVRRHAEKLFLRHGLHRTRERNAVMVYVSVKEQTAVILGDICVDAVIGEQGWAPVLRVLTDAAKQGLLADGICRAVDACAEILATYFPRSRDEIDELTNAPNVA